MLGHIAAFTGGIVKDIQVGIGNAYDYVCEEVSSVPEAFSAGYDHGIMSAPSELEQTEAFHADHEDTIAEKHGKFSSRAA